MHYSFSTQTVVLVGLLAVILPIIFRIVSSPLTLLLISPLVVIIFGVAYLLLNVLLGQILDTNAKSSRSHLTHAARPFAFSTPAAWQAVLTRSQWSHNSPQSLPPLCPDAPLVSSELNDILIMVVRDFVLTWYKELSSSPSFPMAVSSTLHYSIGKLLERASALDVSTLVVKRIMPKVTEHIELYRHSEVALRGAALERRLTQSDELDLLLASRYASKGGKLHKAIDNLSTTFTKQTEEMHLRELAERALPFVLPVKESKSVALKLAVREIIACSVLYPVMELMADPDFWNRSIDQVVSESIISITDTL